MITSSGSETNLSRNGPFRSSVVPGFLGLNRILTLSGSFFLNSTENSPFLGHFEASIFGRTAARFGFNFTAEVVGDGLGMGVGVGVGPAARLREAANNPIAICIPPLYSEPLNLARIFMNSESDTYWLEKALLLAQDAASRDEVPVGAVLVKNGAVLGSGRNLREENHDPLGHAEMIAIHEATRTTQNWRLSGATLYVTLEPCPMCLAACQQARIDRVVFGAWDPKGGALSLGYRFHEDTRMNHRFLVEALDMESCGTILKEFFKVMRAKKTFQESNSSLVQSLQ